MKPKGHYASAIREKQIDGNADRVVIAAYPEPNKYEKREPDAMDFEFALELHAA